MSISTPSKKRARTLSSDMGPPCAPKPCNPTNNVAIQNKLRSMPFGHPTLKTLFMLDPSYLHINHGGCGATPRYIIEKQKHLVNQMEQLPDRWFKKIAPTKIRAAASDLASFIGAEPNEVVFVVNATTGINSVIRSLDLQQGDSVLCLDLTYRPVLNTLRFVCEQREELYPLIELPMPLPLPSCTTIIAMVEDTLLKHPNIRLAVFDHITSPTALVLPVIELCALCKRKNVTVLIDGAHAPGQVHLDMKKINADFYVGTCHKWLFSPKGTAFLWASADNQDSIKPVVTATANNAGFVQDYLFQGTRDETAFCCVPTALTLYRGLGVERIYKHNYELVRQASAHLVNVWNSEILAPLSLRGAFMAAIRVPLPFGQALCSNGGNGGNGGNESNDGVSSIGGYGGDGSRSSNSNSSNQEQAQEQIRQKDNATIDQLMLGKIGHEVLHDLLEKEYNIEYVKLFNFGKRVWVRIACQIYNEMEDYERLGQAVIDVITEGKYIKELLERASQKITNEREEEDGDDVDNWDGNVY